MLTLLTLFALFSCKSTSELKDTSEKNEPPGPQFIDYRGEELEEWLPCLIGDEVDHDGDGFDGCTADCDDFNGDVFPGATVACNIVDDDCDGEIDDNPECPRCVEEKGPDGATYLLCFDRLDWPKAQERCKEEGGELASFHDEDTWQHISWRAVEVLGEEWMWIGLNDVDVEGEFIWTDSSDFDFSVMDQKRNFEDVDCVINTWWAWYPVGCEDQVMPICKLD